jgi:hypothetical protein
LDIIYKKIGGGEMISFYDALVIIVFLAIVVVIFQMGYHLGVNERDDLLSKNLDITYRIYDDCCVKNKSIVNGTICMDIK